MNVEDDAEFAWVDEGTIGGKGPNAGKIRQRNTVTRKTRPKPEGKVKNGESESEPHPLAGKSPKEMRDSLGKAIGDSMALDPLGFSRRRLPPDVRSDALRDSIYHAIEQIERKTRVDAQIGDVYREVVKTQPTANSADFLGELLRMDNDRDGVSIGSWSGSLDRLPEPEFAIPRLGKIFTDVHLSGNGRTRAAQAGSSPPPDPRAEERATWAAQESLRGTKQGIEGITHRLRTGGYVTRSQIESDLGPIIEAARKANDALPVETRDLDHVGTLARQAGIPAEALVRVGGARASRSIGNRASTVTPASALIDLLDEERRGRANEQWQAERSRPPRKAWWEQVIDLM